MDGAQHLVLAAVLVVLGEGDAVRALGLHGVVRVVGRAAAIGGVEARLGRDVVVRAGDAAALQLVEECESLGLPYIVMTASIAACRGIILKHSNL